MATNITGSGATSIGLARAIVLKFNAALTGSVTVTAAGSTQYGTIAQTFGIVTNPVVGQTYQIGGLHGQGAISINPSGTTDLTVTKVNSIR